MKELEYTVKQKKLKKNIQSSLWNERSRIYASKKITEKKKSKLHKKKNTVHTKYTNVAKGR